MKTSNKPTHTVYNVEDRGEGNQDYWQRIGAAWAHEDGKGFNISLSYVPVKAGRIVVRVRSEKPEGAQEDAGE